MYVCTRVLPSISIDDGVFKHCSSEAFAEVLDQFGGIEHYSGTAVGLHLQKFWISFAEVNVVMTLEWHFGQPESVKVTPEQRLGQPCGAKLAPERRLEQPCGAKLALERRLEQPCGAKLALERRFMSPNAAPVQDEMTKTLAWSRFGRPWQQKDFRRCECPGGNFV